MAIASESSEGLNHRAPLSWCMRVSGAPIDRQAWSNNVFQARRILATVGIDLEDYCSISVKIEPSDCVYRKNDDACYWGLGGDGWIVLNQDGGALVHELVHVHLARIGVVDDTNWQHVGWEEAGYLKAADEYHAVNQPVLIY